MEVLVLRPRVLVLVLTKKSYLHHWFNASNNLEHKHLIILIQMIQETRVFFATIHICIWLNSIKSLSWHDVDVTTLT